MEVFNAKRNQMEQNGKWVRYFNTTEEAKVFAKSVFDLFTPEGREELMGVVCVGCYETWVDKPKDGDAYCKHCAVEKHIEQQALEDDKEWVF